MRRILVLLLVLLTVCAAGMSFAALELDTASRQVEFTRKAGYGDPSAARNLELVLRSGYDRHLLWETHCRIEGETVLAQTDFSFSAMERIERDHRPCDGVRLQTVISAGMGDPDEPQEGLAAAYQELYLQTSLGEEKSRVVYLKDYYTYIPVSVSLDFPDYFLNAEPGDSHMAQLELEIAQAFRDYFRIPVLADTQLEISVSRDLSGNSQGFGMGHSTGDDFYLWTESACTPDACYFTFDAHTAQDKLIDTRAIPGGYGIYRVGVAQNDEDMLAAVREMEMVYALDPEASLLALDVTQQHDALLLHTVEEGTYFLTVIGLEDMQMLQKLAVMPLPEADYGWQFHTGDDFLAVVLPGSTLVVFSRGENGIYAVDIVTELAQAGDAVQSSGSSGLAMDYDGQRFAVSGFLSEEELYGQSCGFYLAVYDGQGLRYYGEYSSSLDANSTQLPYSERCLPVEANPSLVFTA